MAINAYAFSYSLTAATLGVLILPSESVLLFPESHAVMLAVMLGCTGVTQLIGPAGDRSTTCIPARAMIRRDDIALHRPAAQICCFRSSQSVTRPIAPLQCMGAGGQC